MANLLKNLELVELSLVDRPANAQAMVSLYKRDNSDENNNPPNEDNMEEIETLKADLARARAEVERLTKSLIDDGYVITAENIAKRQEPEMIEVAGEMVVKSDIPAPVLKALEEAEVAKKQMEIEKAELELTKKATETLPNFSETVAKALVAKFADNEEVMGVLKAADKAFEAAMTEIGKSGASEEFETAQDKLDALVKNYMTENNMKKSEWAKAYAAVAKTELGIQLINKTYKGE